MNEAAPANAKTAAGSAALLQAHNLHKHYRMGDADLHVLRGVQVHVQQGEFLAVLGASGSGKSTLLHLLGGLDRPDQGQVIFRGQNMFSLGASALDRYRAQEAGFVFQFYHLLPELSALENVVIAAMVARGMLQWPAARREVRARATALLERLGLGQRLKHRPNRLSGGERQRVAIARALINQPAVLLADEPTGNLDARTGNQILEVFHEFHADGQTIVMVTHDQRIAKAAQRRVTLEEGRLVENRG